MKTDNTKSTESPYSKEELDEFRGLVEAGESRIQMERIRSRLDMPKFIERVGKDKCDIMFKELEKELKGEYTGA